MLFLMSIGTVSATKTIIDNPTGGDCTSIGSWDAANKTCTLTMDLSEGISVQSTTITLDGDGHTLTGSGTSYGVYIQPGTSYQKIENLNIDNFYQGINIGWGYWRSVKNTTISNSYCGIYLNSGYTAILHNHILDNSIGIQTTLYGGNTFYNNYFNNTQNYLSWYYFKDNKWNRTMQLGLNIIGGPYLGGNFWANSAGTGFSETCNDVNQDGICDSPYIVRSGDEVDYLPLTYPPPPPVILKDFRYTDVNFTSVPAELGGVLPYDNGVYVVDYVLKKKDGNVSSTNPGQLYGVINITGYGVTNVSIIDTFGDQLDVNPGKLGGGVEVIRYNSTTESAEILTDTGNVTFADVDNDAEKVELVINLTSPLGIDEHLMIYVKFKTAEKGMEPDPSYSFVNSAEANIDLEYIMLSEATIEFENK